MPLSRRLRVAAALGVMALVLAVASTDYTVKPGDTLSKIARENGVTVAALVEANVLSNPNLIFVGQTLVIPLAGGGAAYHIVQPGETLSEIARLYDTTAQRVADLNGFPDPNLIYPGSRLLIAGEPQEFQPEVDQSAGVYIVRKGDTLGRIAAAHGTTVTALTEANGIRDPNLIRIGQNLRVPASGWICPVPGSSFINDWGFPRSGGRFHEGNDLYAPANTPVLAPVSGEVEPVEGSRGGIQFWLEGDDGVLYIGTHMSAFGAAGRVFAGDVVGYVGDSGNAKGSSPHLHFEIHPEYNKPVNPYATLVKACG
jgi:murein DD-endopeptidase MepM/ murein hydrolase activator NlpD